jgi:hypothetical protein
VRNGLSAVRFTPSSAIDLTPYLDLGEQRYYSGIKDRASEQQ